MSETVTKWALALRYGRYTQTTNAMRRYEGAGRYSYCALGVFYDTLDPNGWWQTCDGEWVWRGHDEQLRAIQQHLRFLDTKEIIRLNDRLRLSFKDIADYVMEQMAKHRAPVYPETLITEPQEAEYA